VGLITGLSLFKSNSFKGYFLIIADIINTFGLKIREGTNGISSYKNGSKAVQSEILEARIAYSSMAVNVDKAYKGIL
jgi:hypothetical protein